MTERETQASRKDRFVQRVKHAFGDIVGTNPPPTVKILDFTDDGRFVQIPAGEAAREPAPAKKPKKPTGESQEPASNQTSSQPETAPVLHPERKLIAPEDAVSPAVPLQIAAEKLGRSIDDLRMVYMHVGNSATPSELLPLDRGLVRDIPTGDHIVYGEIAVDPIKGPAITITRHAKQRGDIFALDEFATTGHTHELDDSIAAIPLGVPLPAFPQDRAQA